MQGSMRGSMQGSMHSAMPRAMPRAVQAGGAGKILARSETKHRLRKGTVGERKRSALAGVVIDVGSEMSIQDQIRDALTQNAVRVIDLFKDWDEDGDGTVSKQEFRKALPMLGLQVPRQEVDALFDSFDPDGSGLLELKELNKLLRRGGVGNVEELRHALLYGAELTRDKVRRPHTAAQCCTVLHGAG